ncbi:NAD(P)-dependent dehydrogenase, short-chain alcohol dehydrogenase family [Chryseolinea serpens]|uniref:NAD(P)-dependent dehydrogenase, short-chain alcohol dehydrogenase family n=1 Tax=Chryseolinea serpens TaxID=947013 RepID=A0A1M5K593_9BACT|nr:oxidoreductase [Chryseolinea serpens]SHG47988.1 NAD(P)-dependent dehydrogenase, short-chain alcohol dehydrogenase family [Chryseolinea serpens]
MWTKANMSDQSGKTFLVTGANSGIGYETALGLYEAGATVIVACRSKEKADEAISGMKKQGGKGKLEPGVLDLSDLDSVRDFADIFLKTHSKLDVLVNNAGVMVPPASKTRQGYELQFGVNFLEHFALTGYLYPLLKKTPQSRIVTVSSMAYLRGAIDFENLRSEKDYDDFREYAQSKLGNLLFALELQRRITAHGDSVTSIAAQPGANETNLARSMSEEAYQSAKQRIGALMPMAQGALSILYPSVSPDAHGGRLYGPDGDNGYRGYPAEAVMAPVATDEATARKLWEKAEEITGVRFPD